jgi:DNA-binding NtrC family response regulator
MSRNLSGTLLVIDDDQLFCDAVCAFFAGGEMKVLCAHSISEGQRLCVEKKIDVVLLDQKLPDGLGVDLCTPILAANDQTKIIFITAYPTFDNAVKAVRSGAWDYLAKPVDTEDLRLTVDQAFRTLELERVEQIHEYANRRDNAETVLIGADGGLKEVQQMIRLSAGSDAPALITGETGTGKNVVAKSIHYLQAENMGSFVGINCAALPENLIEAELFGYEKGAFTGAVISRKGIFEMAEGGTLFLDEIGDLPLHLQSKLLGVLDEKKLKRLGGQSFRKVDVRIIAATNINLEEAIRAKRFREDLYYRLSVLRIHIPPLRKRRNDIAGLCRHFLLKAARTGTAAGGDKTAGGIPLAGQCPRTEKYHRAFRHSATRRDYPPVGTSGKGRHASRSRDGAKGKISCHPRRNGTAAYPYGLASDGQKPLPYSQSTRHIPLHPHQETQRLSDRFRRSILRHCPEIDHLK